PQRVAAPAAAEPVAMVPAVAAPPPSVLAPQKVPTPDSSMVTVLRRMGVPVLRASHDVILNAYFAALVRHARIACGAHWPQVVTAAGLEPYLELDPPDDGSRSAPVAAVSSLAEA